MKRTAKHATHAPLLVTLLMTFSYFTICLSVNCTFWMFQYRKFLAYVALILACLWQPLHVSLNLGQVFSDIFEYACLLLYAYERVFNHVVSPVFGK